MSKQFRINRKVQTVPVVAGGFATIQLPRTYDYESVFLRIAGGVQVTTNFATVRAEAPCQAVPRVEIVADGKNTLYSAPFWHGSLGNYLRALTQQGARATTPPSNFTVATYQVEAIAVIDFQTVDGVRPKDSNFRSSSLSLFECKLTFGQAADLFTGAGVGVFNGLNVEAWTQEVVELPDENGQFTSPAFLKKVSTQDQVFLASNPNAQIILPAGNLIRSVMARTEGGVTAGEPSTSLNGMTLKNGVDIRYALSGGQVRAKNNADNGLFTSGYYVADVLEKGSQANLSELWDVTGNAQPMLEIDITGGANVRGQFVTTEYIPVL